MKKTLELPDAPVMMRDLVKATAAVTVPDWHGVMRDPDPAVHPARVSLRKQAEDVHAVALTEMALRGEIVARSALYRTPYPSFDITQLDKCMVTFGDAQLFCKRLDLELNASPPDARQGQAKKLAPEQENEAKRRLRAGETQTAVAKIMGVSRTTIAKYAPAKQTVKVAGPASPWPALSTTKHRTK